MIQKEILKLKPKSLRIIDEEGKSLGIFSFEEALKLAQEKNKDLFILTTKTSPIVVKLGDYSKFLYLKKKKKSHKKSKEQKTVRIGVNEAKADLERKVKQIEKFLENGHAVEVKMVIKGRQQIHYDFAKEKFLQFLNLIKNKVITQPIRENPNMIVAYLARK